MGVRNEYCGICKVAENQNTEHKSTIAIKIGRKLTGNGDRHNLEWIFRGRSDTWHQIFKKKSQMVINRCMLPFKRRRLYGVKT